MGRAAANKAAAVVQVGFDWNADEAPQVQPSRRQSKRAIPAPAEGVVVKPVAETPAVRPSKKSAKPAVTEPKPDDKSAKPAVIESKPDNKSVRSKAVAPEPATKQDASNEPAPPVTRLPRRRRTEQPSSPPPPAPASVATETPSASGRPELVLGPAFLMCYDDSAKRSVSDKIAEALAAYAARFNDTPDLVLVNAGVAADVQLDHVVIERRGTVPPNNFWVGKQPVAPRVAEA